MEEKKSDQKDKTVKESIRITAYTILPNGRVKRHRARKKTA
ncbi:hypothetical protein [Anaerospora hongkongensis]|nr:hypothetical protein [Anaerospora hongkongensis]